MRIERSRITFSGVSGEVGSLGRRIKDGIDGVDLKMRLRRPCRGSNAQGELHVRAETAVHTFENIVNVTSNDALVLFDFPVLFRLCEF